MPLKHTASLIFKGNPNVPAGLNIFAVKKSWNKIDKQAKLLEPKRLQNQSGSNISVSKDKIS